MNDVRNALSHGGAPPRRAYVGGVPADRDWGILTIGDNTTRDFQVWLDAELPKLANAAEAFAKSHL